MNVEFYVLCQILLSHLAEKATLIEKKSIGRFLEIMVETFCTTCAVPGYPCSIFSQFQNSLIKNNVMLFEKLHVGIIRCNL